MQLIPGIRLERALVEGKLRVLADPLEGQGDDCLLVVGVGILPHECVYEPPGRLDLAKLAAKVERLTFRRPHGDSIAPSRAYVELHVRRGEAGRAPPLCEPLRYDARREHTR